MSARTTATTAATTGAVERPAVPVPRDGWVQVANAFIDAAPLDNERLAHVILMSYAWDEEACHPYQGELASRLGVSVRTIKRRVGELRAAALVTVERGGGQDHPNVYHLHVRPVRDDDDDVRFTTILHRVLDDATLSQGARRAYIVLCRRAGGNGWCPCSHAALGAAIGVKPRVVYDYVRELADVGYLRITERRGRSNRYTVETPARRKRSAGPGAIPPLAVVPTPTSEAATTDTRWQALYVALMRVEPTKRLGRRVRTLLADVGEATVLEAIEGAAEFAARVHARTLTIGMIRVEVGKIRGEDGLPALDARPAVEVVEIAPPPPDMEPAWRDTLNELRGEFTPENYKRWLEATTVEGFDGGLLRVGVPDRVDQQWLDKRLRGPIERALGRVAPGVRVAFEVREEAAATDEALRAPPVSSPSRASPAPGERLTIARCAHCHYAPCRCPRKERRARERGVRKGGV